MRTRNPIVIFGTGRSGTTIFSHMLSEHPGLEWLSGLSNVFPDKPVLNRALMRALGYPALNRMLRGTFRPSEAYDLWDHCARGFSAPCRDILPTDVTERNKQRIQQAMSKMMTGRENRRLLIKITGWPRLGFLSEVFEDARFIHVLRDGRAVANSLINVDFWSGWAGPQNWRWGPLSSLHHEEWNEYSQSFLVLAAIEWKMLMDATERAKAYVNESDLLEVKYEQLCSDPIAVFKQVAEFAALEWTDRFEGRLNKYAVRNTNYKWQQELNANQQRELNEVLKDYLERYGYL